MKISILDDDPQVTKLLKTYAQQFGSENHRQMIIDTFHHPNDFLTYYPKDVDLIIMDIDMPGLNGIETAKELRRIDPAVALMFVTNMAQFALQGYEVDAMDYVIKPISYGDFAMKMQKALRYLAQNHKEKMTIQSKEGVVNLNVMDILYIEVIRHNLIYHTVFGDFTERGVMKEVEQVLESVHFIRCNHHYLVNLKYVSAISGNALFLGNEALTISRNKKKSFMDAFTKYVGGFK